MTDRRGRPVDGFVGVVTWSDSLDGLLGQRTRAAQRTASSCARRVGQGPLWCLSRAGQHVVECIVSEAYSRVTGFALVRTERLIAMDPDFGTYRLTEEHDLLRESVRALAEDKIAPRAAEIDATAEFPWDVYDALVRSDLHATHI